MVAIIALFSGSYCHGEEVAEAVSRELRAVRIEKDLLTETEKEFGIEEKKLVQAMSGSTSLFNRFTREREKNVAALRSVLSRLITEDNRLIFGYAVHLLPTTISHVLKVCVIANHDYRVDQVVETESKSPKDADRIIRRDDEERLEWTKYLFDKTPYEESLYDIVIPTHSTSVDEAVKVVCEYARSVKLQRTSISEQAVRDFQLSARVNLALVEEGHNVDVHSVDGKVTLTINEYVVRLKHLEDELNNITLKVPGVREVITRKGQQFKAPSSNPWANIEAPPKVLLVDDEKEYVHALSERLETRDIGAAVVYDGEQALEFVEKDEPDVMVLDLMMPGIDGIEVLRRIKKQRPHIEVIILTGHGSEREETLARELGAFAYLSKPVDVDHLTQLMKKAYEKAGIKKSAADEGEDDTQSVK